MNFEKIRNITADLINEIYEEEYENMPYKSKGNTVYKKEGGHLTKVGTSKNPKAYMKALYANSKDTKKKK